MKIRVELDDSLDASEVVIRTKCLTPEIEQLQGLISRVNRPPLTFYKGTSEYFISLSDLLFFETEGTKIYGHTKDQAYEVRLKLYELEDLLPSYFCRIAKSTIVNVKKIYSLDKSFSGTSTLRFYETHKQVHASRHYYQLLKEKLQEVR